MAAVPTLAPETYARRAVQLRTVPAPRVVMVVRRGAREARTWSDGTVTWHTLDTAR